jgi:chromosome segregation protein
MPIAFSRIRIAGFKSFAEPALVEIHPGLTGIVGPNGCGKSNVVEALRWAMGESSAKSLRGGEMDDVIFAGTANRPARNLAEVSLTLEPGSDAGFPAPFDQQSELEVSRRIERGAGSTFRVNGKEARGRDIQTLFADLASGARSSAMVSQGRVSAIVGARPDERRAILEEAAGISGLHSRRHEAELKLRAAEANLERAEDLRAQLTAQLAAVQKQAKQANRYRNLSGLIRAAEAELLAVQRARTEAARAAARERLAALQAAIAVAAETAAAESAAAVAAGEALPGLRSAESETRTALERRRIAREQIEAEQAAARAALASAREALARIGRDRAHADQLRRDAQAAEERLAAEAGALAAEAAVLPAQLAAAAEGLRAAEVLLHDADAALHRATAESAALAARFQALTQARALAEGRARKLAAAHAALVADRAALQPVDPARLAAAGARVAVCQQALQDAIGALEQADAARGMAQAAHQAARARLHETEPMRVRLAAERQALAEILGVHKPGEVQEPGAAARLIDGLTVPAGLEAAIGAALGDDLELTMDVGAPRHFLALPVFEAAPALPGGVAVLGALVGAPPALARALSQVGLAEEEAAARLQMELLPGQSLVTAQGAVWRWDGFHQRAGAPTAAAIRLQQRNRLTELTGRLASAEEAHAVARMGATRAQQAEQAAQAAEAGARAGRRTAEQALDRARSELAELQRRAEQEAARIAALEAQIARVGAERAAADAERAAAVAAADGLADPAAAKQAELQARSALTAARAAEHAARSQQEALARQAQASQARQRAILAERAGWGDRARDAAARSAELDQRHAEAEAHERAVCGAPERLAAAREAAIAALAEAERAHAAAAARLKGAEAQAAAAARADRDASNALAAAREAVLRAESDVRDADHAWGTVAERILEKLGVRPDLPAVSDLSADAEERARRKHERLGREREEMGPVNLRAELEAEEIALRLASIDEDRDELATAINKLRGSIGHLNREGRDRLNQVFAEVDKHFQQLFARMFGGGRAQLALVGSDDPLQAGLEIYAQPPGKKLATLSLLSGGEQALTALSLIFAVFRCNPAPVCVLDEVDAPLDDAIIDRFCTLLADMVRETGTRFLVVTHHHMTMARMDRLYGVTMQERGVSRLLSVDLQLAAEMVEPVRIAAE